jgi:hypothetical protein
MAQVCTTYTNIDGTEEEFCYDDGTTDTSEPVTDDVDYTKIYDWNENPDGSKQKLNADGSIAYQDPDGSTYSVSKNGIYTTESEGKTWNYDPKKSAFVDSAGNPLKDAPANLLSKVMSAVKANPLAALGTAYGAIKSLSGSDSGGYNVPVPKMDLVQQQIQYNDPNRRAGSGGRQYFTDPRYVKEGDAASIAGAQGAAEAQAKGILAAYKPAEKEVNPWVGKMKTAWNPSTTATSTATDTTTPPAGIAAALPSMPTQEQLMDPKYKLPMASGGIAAAKGRYLRGGTDGMADKIPTSIDGDQPAALSHGEFVIPADVVSHLGNGNSDAGAEKLYQMMDRIRQARTGTKQQGKKINPDKFMPGGLAASKYAAGGSVQKFETGGTATGAGGVPLDTSKTSSLSPWAGDYVTNMLGKTQALVNAPQQTYGGPLTAGASDLQKQGFAGLSETAQAGYAPTTFTSGTFDANAANKYMNPYLQAALNPQLEEARRQSQITAQQNAAKMTGAGAFGGSRQAILDAENQRALGANLANITGTGYSTAYDKAMAQFNAEQGRGLDTQKATEASRQYSADYGLKSLSDLMRAGETQRAIESEGIAADKRQFEEQQARPYTNLEFQRKMVEGLPIGTQTTSVNQDAMSKMMSDVSGLASLYDKLSKLIPGT